MKKIITAFSIATLLCVSSAFAAEQSTANANLSKQQQSSIVAFQNIESSALTTNEMQIAGSGLIKPYPIPRSCPIRSPFFGRPR
jgi:hypothetical protein